MNRIVLLLILIVISNCLRSQTGEILHIKSFYYDVDNFSLTAESMFVLKEFVEEVKTKPIEIIEILGYIEKTGSEVNNHIRSKKRMHDIKSSIDTTMIIHQCKPINLNYPPAFLYSYTDGINWRRVDIKYRYKDPIILLPSKYNDTEDPFNIKKIDSDNASNDQKQRLYTNTNQLKFELTEIEENFYKTENEAKSLKDSIEYIQIEKQYDSRIYLEKKVVKKSEDVQVGDSSNISKEIENKIQNEIPTTSIESLSSLKESRIQKDSIQLQNKNDLQKVAKKDNSTINIETTKTLSQQAAIDYSKSSTDQLTEEKELIEEEKIRIENNESNLNKNEKISTQGKSKNQIDQIINREKSSNRPVIKNHPDLGMRLSKIRIQDLDNAVVLLSMNLQFEGDVPIISSSSLIEMDDLLNFLIKNNSVDAFIRGHVCCGDDMTLSKKRAKHIFSELIRRGISEERLRYQGFSNSLMLVQPEITEIDRSKNRRVDIVFSKNNSRSNEPVPIVRKLEKDTLFDPDTTINLAISESLIQIQIEENGNGEFLSIGKTQNQIDNLLVREVNISKIKTKVKLPDMESKLEKINIQKLNNSIALVIMGAQFEGVNPIITESSTKEMTDIFNFLNQNKQIHVFIRGHVCCGDDLKLSKKRAKYIYSELIERGINPKRLRYEGFSNKLLLVSPEKTDKDRTKNRRVDIIFSVK